MKIYEQSYKSVISGCLLLLCIFPMMYLSLVFADEQPEESVRDIPEEEMPTVLNVIGESIRSNYERIKTWSGEIEVKTNWLWTGIKAKDYFEKLTDRTGENPQELLQIVEEKVAFVVDAKKGFVYIDNYRGKPCRFQNLTTGKELGASPGPYLSGPFQSTLIATPDYIVESEPGRWDEKFNLTNMRAVKKPSQKQSGIELYAGIDDPRKVFMTEGIPWEHFNSLTKQIKKLNKIDIDGHKFKIEECKKGQITEYKIVLPASIKKEIKSPEEYVILTKVYSSQYAFNIIYWEVKSGSGKIGQLYTWKYELVDNVYLPKRVTKKNYDSNGRVTTDDDRTYINNKVNQEILPGTFELTNLKLKDGDILVDEVSKEEYKYEAATHTFKLNEKREKAPLPEK